MDQVRELLEYPELRAALVVLGAVIAAFVAELILVRVVGRLVGATRTQLDDQIIEVCRRPMFFSILLVGIWWGATILGAGGRTAWVLRALLTSTAIILWSLAAFAVSTLVLRSLAARARRRGKKSLIQPRTIPIFDMMLKIGIVAGAIYFSLLAWKIDATAWVASAGIAGIAVGFAAKDTLANLFAGIFIVADAPYKVGDFINLDGGLRGRVTSIGIRSTRILTLDDVEITVPNANIANSKIINEAGGPAPKQRVAVDVQAAYGSDIDRVQEVLLGAAVGVELVCSDPSPTVRFKSFGDSGLDFRLLVWLEEAARRDELVHILNCRVYKAFDDAGINIPFPQTDLWVKELPPGSRG